MIKEGEPKLLMESVFLGVIGALSAQLFIWVLRICSHFFLYTLAGYRPPGLSESGSLAQAIGPHGLWLIPLVTTLGGLLSGALVYGFAPEAEGHGTDAVVDAYHRKQGLIRPQVPPVKVLASAITIGSGGAAGREGPIALTAAGLASIYATLAHRTEEERRMLVLIGMAAGLSAIFRTPLGTAVFAIEVLYGNMEFELGAFLYTMVSSAVAYAVNGLFVGFQPLFRVPAISIPTLSDYAWYAVLGVASGLVATLLPVMFYRVRDLFRALPVPVWTKPALGGLGVGVLALRFPQVLGGGYGWIQQAIDGQLAVQLLLILVFAKMVAFSLTVSSGGSGGVFAPSLFIGAMLGGGLAAIFHQQPAVFVIVGMAAVFGAAARVPVATMLMVTEMAGGYHLLVPTGTAVMLSYLLQGRLSSLFKYRSLYEGQVATIQDSPAHYLEHIKVALSLLGRGTVPMVDKLGHIDLVRLLKSGVEFDLPADKQLTLVPLPGDSSYLGKSIGELYHDFNEDEFKIAAILRSDKILIPRSETLLNEEDRLLLIASPAALERFTKRIAPLSESRESRTNAG